MAFSLALSNFEEATDGLPIYREDIKELVYGEDDPWDQDLEGINANYVKDEVLGSMLGVRSGLEEIHEHTLGYDQAGLSGTDLHSMGSLIIRMFADVGGPGDTPLAADWMAVAEHFWPVLYNDGFAFVIGAGNIAGNLAAEGKYSDILRNTIAYSAIDVGDDNTEARLFGDTAIRALYDDANDLGEAVSLAGAAEIETLFHTERWGNFSTGR